LQGTASGMWFEKSDSILVSLPGVPYEMKHIMEHQVFSKFKDRFNVASIFHKTILLQGIGESFLAEKMKDWEDRIHADGLGLAYLPSVGSLKLRITSPKGEGDLSKIEAYFEEIEQRLPVNVYGRGEETLSEVVGRLLKDRKLSVGTVESCTGGSVAASFVSIPGSSDYFKGSFLTYSNLLKNKLVGVDNIVLEQYGAVSEEVVLQMAEKGREKLGVDYCVSTSGVAGPDGGTIHKPVGTVWIGVATPTDSFAVKYQFGNDRNRNIQMTVLSAINLLRCAILEIKLKIK
jgi:nicotinamide-nucleotide amidase